VDGPAAHGPSTLERRTKERAKAFPEGLMDRRTTNASPAPARRHADHGAAHRDGGRIAVRTLLREAGLRPTRQRVALGDILYGRGHRHVSAEQLHEEAAAARVPVSLATIYNTLHQFTEAGLLREVAIEGNKTYFDTNVSNHHHFYVEGENRVFDIPGDGVGIGAIPEAPEGMEVVRVDVVVRLRPKQPRG
jgi:Fur family iron response transcriptional regulator